MQSVGNHNIGSTRPYGIPAASPARRPRVWQRSPSTVHATADAPSLSSPSKSPLVLHIYQPKHQINWERWEIRILKLIDEREAREAALVAQGGDQGGTETETEDDLEITDASTRDLWASHFQQYDDPSVHLPGLTDGVYLAAWEAAIASLGPTHIKGKVVVDMGCGPGVLSLMCAKAGAKRVIAVDGSQAMVDIVQQAAAANGYGGVIEAVCARVEDLKLVERADVLVCNWPGVGLLSGGMLRSLAVARRSLLKPGGLVLPSSAELHVTGIEDRAALSEAKQSWENVAGFDLTPAMSRVVLTPRVAPVPRASQLCTSTARAAQIDLTTLTPAMAREGVPAAPFRLECSRDERIFGLAVHFDLAWAAASAADSQQQVETPIVFTTDPRAPPSHFQQVVLSFPRSIKVQKGDVLQGSLSLMPCGPLGVDVAMQLRVEFAGVAAECTYNLVHAVPRGAYAAMVQRGEE